LALRELTRVHHVSHLHEHWRIRPSTLRAFAGSCDNATCRTRRLSTRAVRDHATCHAFRRPGDLRGPAATLPCVAPAVFPGCFPRGSEWRQPSRAPRESYCGTATCCTRGLPGLLPERLRAAPPFPGYLPGSRVNASTPRVLARGQRREGKEAEGRARGRRKKEGGLGSNRIWADC